jgi:transposase-like protein
MGPPAVSANKLAETVGVSQETLSRWLRQARSVEGMSSPKKRAPRWTGAEKLRVVLAADGLADADDTTDPMRAR